MTNVSKNILTGLMFATGILGLMSGEFIISSALFAATTFTSNLSDSRKKHLK